MTIVKRLGYRVLSGGQILCSSCPVPLSIVSFHLLPNFLMNLVFPFRNGFIVRKWDFREVFLLCLSSALKFYHCLLPWSHILTFSLLEVKRIGLWEFFGKGYLRVLKTQSLLFTFPFSSLFLTSRVFTRLPKMSVIWVKQLSIILAFWRLTLLTK